MIASREDLLAAVRRAEITAEGLRIGPVHYVSHPGEEKDILFARVVDEAGRRALLTKIKLAGSKFFKPEALWGMPGCSEKIPF